MKKLTEGLYIIIKNDISTKTKSALIKQWGKCYNTFHKVSLSKNFQEYQQLYKEWQAKRDEAVRALKSEEAYYPQAEYKMPVTTEEIMSELKEIEKRLQGLQVNMEEGFKQLK